MEVELEVPQNCLVIINDHQSDSPRIRNIYDGATEYITV